MQDARGNMLVGPNVIANALPYVGGGLVLTAIGTYAGLSVFANQPELFMPTSWGALIVEVILFFVGSSVAQKANNAVAMPLLATYSLLSGYTLTFLVALALATPNVGLPGMGVAAMGCGIAFVVGKKIGSNLSEEDGFALTRTFQIGLIGLCAVLVISLVLSFFGIYTPTFLDVAISGFGVVLFAGGAVVDFFILPRTYDDRQYLAAALSMYLTYINLFVFILRLLIAINSRD